MTPYYDHDGITIYHGDCREVSAWLEADVLITDPPYGLQSLAGSYGRYGDTIANDASCEARDVVLSLWDGPIALFGSPRLPEPPGVWHDRLVWDKVEPGLNGGAWRYTHELIFIRGPGWVRTGADSFSILRTAIQNGSVERRLHPHRKPVDLMRRLVGAAPEGVIADPFLGSGSTLRAAMDLGRRAIGVEVDERYCEIAARRLSQQVLAL